MSVQAISWVLQHSKSEGSTRCVLVSIANHVSPDGEGWVYVDRVLQEANCSEHTYRRAIRWAVDNGELVREFNRGDATKAAPNRRPNSFRFVALGVPNVRGPKLDTPPESHPQNEQIRPPKNGTPEPSLFLEPSKEPSTTRVGFAEFWSVYPRKEAKGAAKKAWTKAVRRVEPERIVAGALRYRDDPNRDPGFTAHPSSWLNAERWDDEPLPSRIHRETSTDRTFDAIQNVLGATFNPSIGAGQ